MSFLDIFRKKQTQKIPTISEDEYIRREAAREERRHLENLKRNLDLEVMCKEAELRKAEIQLEIDEIKAEYTDNDDSFNPDNLFSSIMQKIISKGVTEPQAVGMNLSEPQAQATTDEIIQPTAHISDEDLHKLWKQIPAHHRLMAKMMSEDKIRNFIVSNYPNIDADTVSRAIKIAKS